MDHAQRLWALRGKENPRSVRNRAPWRRSASRSGIGGCRPGVRGEQPEQGPPAGTPAAGAPREPPAAAADSRWQQTAGNGRAPAAAPGDGAAGGGLLSATVFYFL